MADPLRLYRILVKEANRATAAFNAPAGTVPIADVVAAWRRAEAEWDKVQRATMARKAA